MPEGAATKSFIGICQCRGWACPGFISLVSSCGDAVVRVLDMFSSAIINPDMFSPDMFSPNMFNMYNPVRFGEAVGVGRSRSLWA